jgi:hypothetical protein
MPVTITQTSDFGPPTKAKVVYVGTAALGCPVERGSTRVEAKSEVKSVKLEVRGLKSEVRSPKSEVVFAFLLQLRGDEECLRRIVVLNPQHIRFAADLAVFDVALPASGGFVHRS